eukprot:5891051-Pleurochrysis_carterae.AAC.1
MGNSAHGGECMSWWRIVRTYGSAVDHCASAAWLTRSKKLMRHERICTEKAPCVARDARWPSVSVVREHPRSKVRLRSCRVVPEYVQVQEGTCSRVDVHGCLRANASGARK